MKKKQLSMPQFQHISKLLKQKFISPYKILYMLDQKAADYFKSRNIPEKQSSDGHNKDCSKKKTHSCSCSLLSSVLIPYNKQTKIEQIVTDTIITVPNYLNEIMEFCEDRFQNIIESGKKDNLQITADVEKFLVEKIIFEGVHNILYAKCAKKIQQSSQSMNTQIGLWATPATWKAKYPNIQLTIFKGENLQQINKMGFTTIKFSEKSSLHERDDLGKQFNEQYLFKQLELLEKDGKFEQSIVHNSKKDREIKVLDDPERYGFLQDGQYFPQMKLMLMILQSIPFQINMKMNLYMTINESIQSYYINISQLHQRQTTLQQLINSPASHKYSIFIPIGFQLFIKMRTKTQLQTCSQKSYKSLKIKSGNLLIFEPQKIEIEIQTESSSKKQRQNKGIFLITHRLYKASKL